MGLLHRAFHLSETIQVLERGLNPGHGQGKPLLFTVAAFPDRLQIALDADPLLIA
jgi:hypothetical protein